MVAQTRMNLQFAVIRFLPDGGNSIKIVCRKLFSCAVAAITGAFDANIGLVS